jgi:hypothetical protein
VVQKKSKERKRGGKLLKTQDGAKRTGKRTKRARRRHTPGVLHGCEKKRLTEEGICKSLKIHVVRNWQRRSVVVHCVIVLKREEAKVLGA